jgi:hypothetical protein
VSSNRTSQTDFLIDGDGNDSFVVAVGAFGNASRNLLIGPGQTDVDMSLLKNFVIRERWNLQFRGEAFDLSTHPNFNQPVGNLSSATYGQITGSAAGRILQGAIKLRW